jgi:cbb3-type cytochrome oxidase subunit 3
MDYLPHIAIGILILLVIVWLYLRQPDTAEDMEEEIEDDDDVEDNSKKINN